MSDNSSNSIPAAAANPPPPQPAEPAKFEFHLWSFDIGTADSSTEWKTQDGSHGSCSDRIEFQFAGKVWTLRNLLVVGGELLPLDATLAAKPTEPKTPYAALQVSVEGWTPEKAKEEANLCCWLLGFAYNSLRSWHEMVEVQAAHRKFLEAGSPRHGASRSKPLIVNSGKGHLKQFVESAEPVFRSDLDWWKETFDWCNTAATAQPVEASIMTYMMLLDRISDHIIGLKKHKFGKQIGDDLATALDSKESRRALTYGVSCLFNYCCGNWTGDRSEAVVKKIEEWNNQPSFPNKIGDSFQLTGLNSPDKTMIGERHALLHGGKLRKFRRQEKELRAHVGTYALALLLRLLNYSGPFNPLGLGERFTDEFLAKN